MSRSILAPLAAAAGLLIASAASAAPAIPLGVPHDNSATFVRYHGGCPPGYKVTSHGGCKLSDYLRKHPAQVPYYGPRHGYRHHYHPGPWRND